MPLQTQTGKKLLAEAWRYSKLGFWDSGFGKVPTASGISTQFYDSRFFTLLVTEDLDFVLGLVFNPTSSSWWNHDLTFQALVNDGQGSDADIPAETCGQTRFGRTRKSALVSNLDSASSLFIELREGLSKGVIRLSPEPGIALQDTGATDQTDLVLQESQNEIENSGNAGLLLEQYLTQDPQQMRSVISELGFGQG
ncbi:hypothetical protein VNO77_31046 [Canavalia gladiata]|uniref:Uncharacterized protein n=1 Tax=Canavalia gladiata TaxID=3824 RepID=A0AAN9Q7J8_CANGL